MVAKIADREGGEAGEEKSLGGAGSRKALHVRFQIGFELGFAVSASESEDKRGSPRTRDAGQGANAFWSAAHSQGQQVIAAAASAGLALGDVRTCRQAPYGRQGEARSELLA